MLYKAVYNRAFIGHPFSTWTWPLDIGRLASLQAWLEDVSSCRPGETLRIGDPKPKRIAETQVTKYVNELITASGYLPHEGLHEHSCYVLPAEKLCSYLPADKSNCESLYLFPLTMSQEELWGSYLRPVEGGFSLCCLWSSWEKLAHGPRPSKNLCPSLVQGSAAPIGSTVLTNFGQYYFFRKILIRQ